MSVVPCSTKCVPIWPGLGSLPTTSNHGLPTAILHLRLGNQELRLFSLLTTLGTPLDISAQELAIESFFPADDATERWFQSRAAFEVRSQGRRKAAELGAHRQIQTRGLLYLDLPLSPDARPNEASLRKRRPLSVLGAKTHCWSSPTAPTCELKVAA